MENWNKNNNDEQNQNWQQSENDKDLRPDSEFNMNSAEANGYGTDANTADDALYALGDDDDDDDRNEEEETPKRDWGNVDPLSDTDGLPSGVDPSGPGSAV